MKIRYTDYLKYAFLFIIIFLIVNCDDDSSVNNDQFINDWDKDVYYFSTQLPQKHINLFHNITKSEFDNDIDSLRQHIEEFEDYEVIIELMKIIAKVGDSHTNIRLTGDYIHIIPIELALLKDGLYPVKVPLIHEGILMKRIVKIDNTPVDTVYKKIKKIIPHENEAQVMNMFPGYLSITEFLYALNITENKNEVNFTFTGQSTVKFTAGNPSSTVSVYDNQLPYYYQNNHLNYWYKVLDDNETMYIQYNKCSEMEQKPFSSFSSEVFTEIDKGTIKKIIIDLRLNSGGNSSVATPLIDGLKDRINYLNHKNIYVAIGRKTFSSAILNAMSLKNLIAPVFIGEATGGKPNHYGEIKSFSLPNSLLKVYYSTKYFTFSSDDVSSLEPDIQIDLSSDDVRNGTDPVVDYVINAEIHLQ